MMMMTDTAMINIMMNPMTTPMMRMYTSQVMAGPDSEGGCNDDDYDEPNDNDNDDDVHIAGDGRSRQGGRGALQAG